MQLSKSDLGVLGGEIGAPCLCPLQTPPSIECLSHMDLRYLAVTMVKVPHESKVDLASLDS